MERAEGRTPAAWASLCRGRLRRVASETGFALARGRLSSGQANFSLMRADLPERSRR
jgi:hypothetical protein